MEVRRSPQADRSKSRSTRPDFGDPRAIYAAKMVLKTTTISGCVEDGKRLPRCRNVVCKYPGFAVDSDGCIHRRYWIRRGGWGGGKAKRDMGGAGVTIVVTRTVVDDVVALRHVQDERRWSSCGGFGLYQATVVGGRAGLWLRPINGG